MARYKVVKSMRTGNMFVSDYFIVPRMHRPLAGQEIVVTGIQELAQWINNHPSGRYDVSAIKGDVRKYRDYLKIRKEVDKIRNEKEREMKISQLQLEMGKEEF
jgi:hypothetical protein